MPTPCVAAAAAFALRVTESDLPALRGRTGAEEARQSVPLGEVARGLGSVAGGGGSPTRHRARRGRRSPPPHKGIRKGGSAQQIT